MRLHFVVLSLAVMGIVFLGPFASPAPEAALQSPAAKEFGADRLMRGQPACFVPNLGQWEHTARFVYRSGPMTLFVENRGWALNLEEPRPDGKAEPRIERPLYPQKSVPGDDEQRSQEICSVAMKMTFEGDSYVPGIVGEGKLSGHHNYFLSNDESRWRTGVPLYSSVHYDGLYPRINLRLREMNGVPEYDLLLQPGADLSRVTVHVEGGQGLSVASDGSLVIETVLGRLTQPVPKTWEVGSDGRKREVACNFTLLGAERFGFEVPGWDGDTSLTIDPGLIWSTYLGGPNGAGARAVCVDTAGMVTVAGGASAGFPTTSGAYNTTTGGIFVSRLDPSKTGSAQLVYSTFLGGGIPYALSVDANGVVTVAGATRSGNFPTTSGAYDTTYNGGWNDVFVSRLDPSKTGSAQLVYSTFLGGNAEDLAHAIFVEARGVVTVVGVTISPNFPTTSGAYDRTYNGVSDAFVSRLDLSKTGIAQLAYSTFLGGSRSDNANALSVDASGVVTMAGVTGSQSHNFPTTIGAYDTTPNGNFDVFVSRLDPTKAGSAQLVYSTFLGGNGRDYTGALSVDTSGVVTVAGETVSTNFPTTIGAYNTTRNGGWTDVFVSRLDPTRIGSAQLVYSTYLGGCCDEFALEKGGLFVDASGVVTVAGATGSVNFPTTIGAYNTIHNGPANVRDVFVSRLDPTKIGSRQLVYSTFLGGSGAEWTHAFSVDASGVVTVGGWTYSTDFPTTSGAYGTTSNGTMQAFVSRLDMGVALYADTHQISLKSGGTQKLTVNAGKAHANRLYWVFGSMTGTAPGLNLLGVHIPLNPDAYTDLAMGLANTTTFARFQGTLDATGLATSSLNVPTGLPPIQFVVHHAYVVYDSSGRFHMASNAVPLALK